ncbi:DUF3883 domain-containing protein [Tunturiibacter gelidiferens]
MDGTEVFVEVKGMQDSGKAISLTPREVKHAQDNKNSALFIVHSVIVRGKRKPVISGGKMRFLHPTTGFSALRTISSPSQVLLLLESF